MSSIKLKENIVATILSKGLIMLLNFAVIVLTTQLWKADGRGAVAIFTADIGLIAIFANVFTGSSVSYFFSRLCTSKLSTMAYLWSFIVAAVGGGVLLLLGETRLTPFVFMASVLMGVITFYNSIFVGGQKISHYNLITVLQPALLLVFMLLFHWIWPNLGYYCYFYGQIISLLLLILICGHLRRRMGIRLRWDFDAACNRQLFSFGWKTELSSLLQFFNYRLTYYMLNHFIGQGSVGVFSIGVAIAEAIWIVGRSVAVVQFSNVLEQGDTSQSRRETMRLALVSLGVSTLCISVVLLLPESLFAFIFGPEFGAAKRVVLLLTPGVLSIAFSNVIGNYFSAVRSLNILIVKYAIGLLCTLFLSLWLIPRWQMDGACVVNTTSYVVSSAVLLVYYLHRREPSETT